MRRQLRSRRAPTLPHGYRFRLDDQDEMNQNYLADEEEEAEEEAQMVAMPNLEEEEKEEEQKEEEEVQDQPADNTWWQKLQLISEYLWDPEQRMSLARTGQSCRVMIRPFAQSLNFNFNVSEPDTWQHYVISLNGFLQGYNDSLQEEMNVDCPPGQYFIQDGEEEEDKKACQFKRSFLKNCSGLEDPTFGYSTGQPCILLKMNRIVGFRPELGDPVKVSCKVQRGDENDIRSISYYPESASFDLRYYPYYGKLTHVNYTSPLVAMHFTDVVKNQVVPVQCQLKGKGIINDVINDRFVGRVIFTLNIET
ncbi:PREDICTED: protein ATP1B4 isoform X3 [Elephantulus edwardii]|uniref:protein ATP1B4 isoform X3 n=1 Tax=Elephantulus edwardii TaxID=28737 RepID=UPI0003F0C25E|nr:PREDICTED: protein ATP1B4 isoform X3 [Elephantulus edwardii]